MTPGLRTALSRIRPLRPWLAWLALALWFAPTLCYPFGRDQGLYFYVAREWATRGALPYRDSFDQKPPGIYAIHRLANWLSGDAQWGIRAFELAAVLGSGFVLWRAATGARPNGRQAWAGSALLATFYFGTLDYWDTAQCELWEGLSLVCAQVFALERSPPRRRALAVGLASGLAFVLKFPALLTFPVFVAVLAVEEFRTGRGWRGTALSWLCFSIGAVLVPLGFVGYFALRGGLAEAYDVLIGYNAFYVQKKHLPHAVLLWSTLQYWLVVGWVLFWPVLVASLFVAWRVVSARAPVPLLRFATTLALLSVSVAAVEAQGKLYGYHWGVVLLFLVQLVLQSLDWLGPAWQRWLPVAWCSAVMCFGPPWLTNSFQSYPRYVEDFSRYALQIDQRAQFLRPFVGGYSYVYADQEKLGRQIRTRARAGDELQVRGFEPAIYQVSGLGSPCRFFAEFPLHDPELKYRRDEWQGSHERCLRQTRPRFIVSFAGLRDVDELQAIGYAPFARQGPLIALERR